MANPADQYGRRNATAPAPRQPSIIEIGQAAADAVKASSEKAAADVLAAATACEGIAKIVREDAELFANEIKRHGTNLQTRVVNFAKASMTIADSFGKETEKVLGLASEVANEPAEMADGQERRERLASGRPGREHAPEHERMREQGNGADGATQMDGFPAAATRGPAVPT